MNLDLLMFGVAPYVAIALFVAVSLYRYRVQRFSYSSLSSQFLERKLLFWGSIPFHWGIVTILTMHFLAFLLPSAILSWNAAPMRLYLLEGTGLALGLWALVGLLILAYRRLNTPRIQAVSTGMDMVVLAALLVSVVTGVITAYSYRWGSNWYASVASPYLWSLLFLSPKVELMAALPALVKAHVFNFFVLLALFPFTRLVHVLTVPFEYLWRPWQVVVWNRHPGAHLQPHPVVLGSKPWVGQPILPVTKDAVSPLPPRKAEPDTH